MESPCDSNLLTDHFAFFKQRSQLFHGLFVIHRGHLRSHGDERQSRSMASRARPGSRWGGSLCVLASDGDRLVLDPGGMTEKVYERVR